MMDVKVLFLDHAGVLSGAELSLLDIARDYKHSAKVLLFADGPFRKRLEKAGVKVEVLPAPRTLSDVRREGRGIRELRAAPSVLNLSRRVAQLARDYDVLYANSQKALVVGAAAGKFAGRPLIWHLRDILSTDHFSAKNRWLAVTVANNMVARVIANSRATSAAFVEAGGHPEKVHVVYNGIDPRAFESVTTEEVDALKGDLDLANVPVVSVIGRLAPWKGQHVLIEALSQLSGAHALLVGEALFGEHAYAKFLGERAEILGVAGRVHFLGFREDIPRLMRLSDVIVHTSTAPEPFGRTIVEGMMACKPVVASADGAAAEIINHGVSGILVSPGDPETLARELADLLSRPTRSRALARAGYIDATRRFSLQAMLSGVRRQILDVATARGQRASEQSAER